MAHGQRAFDHARLNFGRKVKQSQQVGDMAPRFVNGLGQRFLRMTELVEQPLIGLRFLDRVEILPLDILQQRDLQRLAVAIVADDDGDFVQPRALRRAPAAFASHDLIIVAVRADDDRLDHPALRDGSGEFLERGFVEMAARLAGVRGDRADRDHPHRAACGAVRGGIALITRDIAQQGVEAAAQPAAVPACVAHATSFSLGSRWITSRASAIYASDPLHR